MDLDAETAPIQNKSELAEEVLSVEQRATDQPTNTASQPTSMANQATNIINEEGSHSEQPNLFLNCPTRTQLITSLVSLSDILQSNQPIPEDTRSRTWKEIEDSILLLVNLPPSKPTQPSAEASSGQVLKLLRTDRSNLINYLIDTKDAVRYQQATDNAKRRLIAENEKMVIQLMKLPREELNAAVGASGSAEMTNRDENTGEPASKRPRIDSEVSATNELDRLKEQFTSLESRMNELRSELTLQIQSVDVARSEASFKFEITEVSKFMRADGIRRCSELFWCRGLQWSLSVESGLKGRPKSLGFYLRCEYDDPDKWSCNADFKLILFSKFAGQDLVDDAFHNFSRKEGYGFPSFASYGELTDEENGYIADDDKITLGVEMKAEPVVRG